MYPNLNETYYAFSDPVLMVVQKSFHDKLTEVSTRYQYGLDKPFMPLNESQAPEPPDPAYTKYEFTIPASIQY
jgi:hypothetical protein